MFNTWITSDVEFSTATNPPPPPPPPAELVPLVSPRCERREEVVSDIGVRVGE